MPIRKQDYPSNWKEISLAVRAEADNKCEWCAAPNGRVIMRHPDGTYTLKDWVFGENTSEMKWPRLRYWGLTRVVLTVAHLDRNSKNNDRDNLAALCQRCHLRHDIHQHIANRKYGRHHGKEHQLKLEI